MRRRTMEYLSDADRDAAAIDAWAASHAEDWT